MHAETRQVKHAGMTTCTIRLPSYVVSG